MTQMQDLEARLEAVEKECRQLRDQEAIRKLRHSYWRCISEQRMDDLVNLFAADAFVDLGNSNLQAEGKPAVAELYKTIIGPRTPAGSSYPRGFNHEIDVTGDNTARAVWLGEAPRIDASSRTVVRVGFIYHEEYMREAGEWKISSLKVTNTFRDLTQLAPPSS